MVEKQALFACQLWGIGPWQMDAVASFSWLNSKSKSFTGCQVKLSSTSAALIRFCYVRMRLPFLAGLLECMTNEHNAFAIRLLQEAQFHVVRRL